MKFLAAKPVWAKELTDEYNIMLTLRANVPYLGGTAVLAAAADNFYRLFINGKFVHFGPQKCGQSWWRKDELDIAPYLETGENSIQIDVVHYGTDAFYYELQQAFIQVEILVDGQPVCYTDVQGGGFTVVRNLSKLQKTQRYSYQRPFIEAYILPFAYSQPLALTEVAGIRLLKRSAGIPDFAYAYPQRLVASGTVEPDREDNTHYAYHGSDQHSGKQPGYKPEELPLWHSDHIRHFKETGRREVNIELAQEYSDRLAAGEWRLLEMEHENTGFIALEIEAAQPSEIYITYDEILMEGELHFWRGSTANVLPLTVEAGKHSFFGFEPSVFKYMQVYCLKGDVKISGLRLCEYKNCETKRASFRSSDELLNRLYAAGVETFAQNSVDVFMDCPSRERAGWLCDSFFTSRVEKDLTGTSAIEHDFLENFLIARDFDLPAGMLPMCYPASTMQGAFIPNWAMWFVVELAEYYDRTGDRDMIDKARERVYALVKYFEPFKNAEGLLEKLKGWIFVEWSQANKWVQDINYPSNMMYYMMLTRIARLYDDAAIAKEAADLKETVIRRSWNGTFFEDNAMVGEDGGIQATGNTTEVCQYYAFFCGIADGEHYPQLLQKIIEDFGPGHKCQQNYPDVYPANAFIGNYLRMEILSAYGRQEQILSEMAEYFDYMARMTGTLWENDTPHASCNHGFASHVIRLIYRDVLGLKEADELHKRIVVSQRYAPPAEAQAVLPLQNGEAVISIKHGKRTITVPDGYQLVSVTE